MQARPDARPALHKNAPGLARVLGPEAEALLELVENPPEGSQPLLLQMLYTLTGAQSIGKVRRLSHILEGRIQGWLLSRFMS